MSYFNLEKNNYILRKLNNRDYLQCIKKIYRYETNFFLTKNIKDLDEFKNNPIYYICNLEFYNSFYKNLKNK